MIQSRETLLPSRRCLGLQVLVARLLLIVLTIAMLRATSCQRDHCVDVVLVRPTTLVQRVVAIGRVVAASQIRVGTLIHGRVLQVHVEQGQAVQAGQVLLTLEDAEAKANVAQARASLRQAQAKLSQTANLKAQVADESARQAQLRLDQAQAAYQREVSLFNAGASTKQRLDDAQSALDLAESSKASALIQARDVTRQGADYRILQASVEQAKASVDYATTRLDQTRVVAPAPCIVLERRVEPGDVVQAATQLLILAVQGPVQLSVRVDEKNMSLLHVNQQAQASADAYPSRKFGATITSIAPLVEASTGTVEAKLSVVNPPSYLLPDMSVSVNLDASARPDVLLVPNRAVRSDTSEDPYVFIVAEGKLERRAVTLGIVDGEQREIVSGIESGDQVVVGGDALKAGTSVHARVMNPDGQTS